MATAFGAVGADPFIGYCASLRRELSGEPDVGNLHLRFDEGRGTFRSPPTLPAQTERPKGAVLTPTRRPWSRWWPHRRVHQHRSVWPGDGDEVISALAIDLQTKQTRLSVLHCPDCRHPVCALGESGVSFHICQPRASGSGPVSEGLPFPQAPTQ